MSERLTVAETTDYDAVRNSTLQVRWIRHWATVLGLALADVAAFAVSAELFRVGHLVPRLLFYRSFPGINSPIDVFYILGALFIAVRYVSGDYSRRQLFWDGARLSTIGLLVASMPCLLLLLFMNAQYSAWAELFSWTFVIIGIPVFRQGMRHLMSLASIWRLPTALIGDGGNALEAMDAFKSSLSLGFDVRFLIALKDLPESNRDFTGVTCIGLRDPANIIRRLADAGCLEVVVATETQRDSDTDDLIQRALAAGMGVAVIPPLRHLPLFGLTVNYFFGRDLLLMQVRNNLGRLPGRLFKRFIDLIGSAILLLFLAPVFAVITYLVRRDDGGHAFFVQSRVGRDGREFPCIKFRTMTLDAEDQLTLWKRQKSPLYEEYLTSNFKLRNDPRVTRIGKWLRSTSLDELPQIINVLIGDMSLVGPRPLLAREIGEYGVTFKLYQQIRPGITGLWQISGRSHTRFADRVASDDWYIKNWSFWYDIVILLKTVAVLVSKDGAY